MSPMFFMSRFSWLPECFHPGLLFLSNCTSRGTAWLVTVAVQRRGCYKSLISIRDAGSTYLHFLILICRYSNRLSWEPACRGLCLLLLFYLLSNRNNRSTLSTGPSLDSFFRTNRSIFLVMFINRRSLFGYRNLPLIFYSILRYSVRTEGHTGSVR